MTAPPPESPTPAAGLPVHLTRFVGRDGELQHLVRLAGAARLLTLTGPGGAGKTRLALEAASRVAPAFARVGWTDLAPLGEGALVATQAAAALRVPPRAGATALESIVESVGGDRALLVLDNCEHLVAECAALADALLRACPRLTILATSREALGVASETAWLVPPLSGAEAAELFAERAQAALPSFAAGGANAAAVEEICRRLDGIPLAIELAAARVRVLSPEQIARRLDDAFRLLAAGSRTAIPRHRTLRATMEWSHALLAEREQVLLRRLSVFAGSFSLEAAEAVCAGRPLDVEDILDGVTALVDKSLVVMEPGDGQARYRLLETVRQYARERLAEAGEADAVHEAHARHFVAFAEAAEPHLFAGAGDAAWIGRVGAEVDDLRATAQWAEADARRADVALRLCWALHWYWFATGAFREARERLDAALAPAPHAEPLHRGRALLALGFTAIAQGDVRTIRPALREALRLLADADGPRNLAYVHACLSAGGLFEDDVAGAREHAGVALELLRDVPPHAVHAFVRYYHGRAAEAAGDLAGARTSFEEATRIGREIDHPPAIAHPLAMLGRLSFVAGDLDAAYAHLVESLGIHALTRDPWGITVAMDGLAAVGAARGQHGHAARLLAATDTLRAFIAASPTPAERAERERLVGGLRGALGDEYDRAYAEGAGTPIEKVVCAALGHGGWDAAVQRAAQRRPSSAVAAPARLRVHALGPLQVFVGGKAVEGATWGSARPRELLAFLLVHPEGRTKEQVGLAFWPDASPAQLRNSFHVTLHRLRKALGGADWITLEHDRYRVEPALLEEFDVTAFEREVTDARRALKRREEGAPARLEQALARFRGDFLDGEPAGDWHLEHRERLQRLYVDALMALGERLAAEERHEKAADAFRRVLARDELHEEALRALLRAHAALGERTQALRAYQRFAQRLRDELEAEPARETVRLLERVQSGA